MLKERNYILICKKEVNLQIILCLLCNAVLNFCLRICFSKMWAFWLNLWKPEGDLIKEKLALLLSHLATCSVPFCPSFHGGNWVHCPTHHGTPWASSFLSISDFHLCLPLFFFNRNISTFIFSHYLFKFSVNLNKLKNCSTPKFVGLAVCILPTCGFS